MPGFEFSVPYNSDPATLEDLLARAGSPDGCGGSIREVYLSGPEAASASGRIVRGLGFEEFASLVGRIHSAGVRTNLVMNTTCEGVEWYETRNQVAMRDYLCWTCEGLGVESVTVANPLLIGLIRSWLPDVEICASVLSDVDCVERAKVVMGAGANVITPDVNINRDLDMLRRIKEETGAELKVMVNEGCLYKCPWRKFHFNAVSHIGKNAGRVGEDLSPEDFVAQCTQVAYGVFFNNCNRLMGENPSQILKSGWIRPEDLDEYREVCTYFKIAGRTMPRGAVLRAVDAYMHGSYQGDLLDIMDSSLRSFSLRFGACIDNSALGETGLPKRLLSCGRRCQECGACEEVASKLLRTGEDSDIKRSDRASR